MDRKWVWIRSAAWIAIIVYAVVVMRDPHFGDGLGKAMLETAGIVEVPVTWVEVTRPVGATPPLPAGDLAEAVHRWDPRGGADCPHPGTLLRVKLGPSGLQSASAAGPAASQACFASKVWTSRWPSMPIETEVELGG